MKLEDAIMNISLAEGRVLLLEEGADVVKAASDHLEQYNVVDSTQISFALAPSKANTRMVVKHVKSHAEVNTTNNISNFMFADGAELGESQENIPTMNLINVLTRLSQKSKPTVMAVGCEESVDLENMYDEMRETLSGLLNFIRIRAENFAKSVGEFINAITQIAQSV